MKRWISIIVFIIFVFVPGTIIRNSCIADEKSFADKKSYSIENDKVKFTVVTNKSNLVSDKLEMAGLWNSQYGPSAIETDANFAIDVMYTDWSAPGKINNAENPVFLTKSDFYLINQSEQKDENGSREIIFDFKGKETSIELRLTYILMPEAFYVKRKIAVIDTTFGHHFLRRFLPRNGSVGGVISVVKEGGFGQPVAFSMKKGGAFFGIEYPAADNFLKKNEKNNWLLSCSQEYGGLIGSAWLESDWTVEGITPISDVKYWFFRYLDDIRVVSLHPFSLYNTWYDLRSPEYPHWSPEKVMSEKTSLQMVDILRKSMIEKYKIKLDAFVLDDGWDVYESDWVLRKEQWPNGLKPLADELKKTNTSLGVWVGPTGGYSFHSKRLKWMKEHGYEVVGKNPNNSMLCLAGKNYRELFKKRVTDFTANDGVGYFKWDGIQFSCSEPDHGHPIDIYSRRAVMESVVDMCKSVREKNPNMFLNITSGTWLSPWWVKYANTIWMQGMDYGFSDVPSISQRDAAITYRDFVLYDDFNIQKMWFPISNLMTHGIIKGKHESVGVETEPLDKFTDDVLLYFARGVSMYELYISPDILSDGEWKTIASSMEWARDRFPVLMNSEMVGGNPMKGEAYAHVHFKDKKGIIAARNPVIESVSLKVKLDPALGIDSKASSLVLEKVYPTKWISPTLFRAGESVTLKLEGFETAVYEIYPVDEATAPLLAGVTYDASLSGQNYSVRFHNSTSDAKLLNPSIVKSISIDGKRSYGWSLPLNTVKSPDIVSGLNLRREVGDKSKISMTLNISETARYATLSVLLTPDTSLAVKSRPILIANIDGKETEVKTEPQEGKSQWYFVEVNPGKHDITMSVKLGKDEKLWRGKAGVWLIAKQKQNSREIKFTLNSDIETKPSVPHVWEESEIRRTIKLGNANLEVSD
jgi:hypothetical protein